MVFRFDVCKCSRCSYRTFKLHFHLLHVLHLWSKIKKYIMCCPDLCLTSSMSRVLFILLDPVTSVSWIHVLYVKREHSGIREKILRHPCQADIHYNCSGLWLDYFESALSDGIWFCRLCVEGLFPFNHLYDDNDFMKCIEELSQYSNITARLHKSAKVLNFFDINEGDNDIIQYHGDIDPNEC